MAETLLVFTRREWRPFVQEALRDSFDAVTVVEQLADTDPASLLRQLSTRGRAGLAGLLLIGPREAIPGESLPGPCLDGLPIAVMAVDRPDDLSPWLAAVRATRTPAMPTTYEVLAMWKSFYLAWGEHFRAALHAGYSGDRSRVTSCFADTTSRDALCHRLWRGPQLALYVGHGRSRGWSGYRGVRWHHIMAGPQVRPVGSLITLTCDNLKPGRDGETSFGARWVVSGRAGAFFGAVEAVDIPPLEQIGHFFRRRLAAGDSRTIGQLIAAVDRDVGDCGDAAVCLNWKRFRLVGNPLQPL